MNKKTRYSLIAFGFALFFILAPLIVMYVRGIGYDSKSGRFLKTGILAVRTEPKDAKILLNHKKYRDKSGDIKFLLPGEYEVVLEKENYFKWSKRLQIRENQVTWANPIFSKIFLLLNNGEQQDLGSHAIDFFSGDKLVYATQNSIIVSRSDNPTSSENFSLPKKINSLLGAPDGKQFILYDNTAVEPVVFFFNADNRQVSELGNLFTGPATWQFSSQGQLYALNGDQLYLINPSIPEKTLLQKGVTAYAFEGSNMYYLKKKESGLSLFITDDHKSEGQELLKNISLFQNTEIIISFEKQLYIIGDGTLYKAGSSLVPLASDLQHWDFNREESSLIFFHSGQLDYVNPFKTAADFITRRGNELRNPVLRLHLGYAFFIEGNSIRALELDTRDHQNEYTLYTGSDIKKFTLDEEGKTLFVLDSGTLKSIQIR